MPGRKHNSTPKVAVLDLPNDPHPTDSSLPGFSELQLKLVLSLLSPRLLQTLVPLLVHHALREVRWCLRCNGAAGSVASPQFTIVKGDCNLDSGAGLLIVTGTLTMNGNPDFRGLILVLGQGRVIKTGGGNGDTMGAMMIARFGATGDFLEPTFLVSGGGNSIHQYDSRATLNAMVMSGPSCPGNCRTIGRS